MPLFGRPFLPALICALLWGSSFPAIKTVLHHWSSQGLAHSVPVVLLFAGVRFFLAGGDLLLVGKNLRAELRATSWKLIAAFSLSDILAPMKRLLLFLFLGSLPAIAELAPPAYLALQAKAPEVIEIHVDKVKRGLWISPGEVVTATVKKVSKTASKLKVGDVIKIRYRHVKLKGAGPSPIPLLTKNETYPAWLRKNEGGHYEPAARGYSFRAVKRN